MSKPMRAFLDGAAAALELWPARSRRYDRIVRRFTNDAAALAHDWMAVGRDMRRAMDQVERERDRS
ncbi:MAG: hypothetical protein JNJ47_08890 [Alphaproteobacteria bacterium]|nr:hypothetical protein [Alphaproteobacteria bacterium]